MRGKALDLLAQGEPLTFQQIARSLGRPPSTHHAVAAEKNRLRLLLRVLESEGRVERVHGVVKSGAVWRATTTPAEAGQETTG